MVHALDSGLDANRSVYCSHDRCRYFNDGRVATEQVRRQAADIQAYAAADSYDRLLAPALNAISAQTTDSAALRKLKTVISGSPAEVKARTCSDQMRQAAQRF